MTADKLRSSTSLLRRARALPIWAGHDAAFGPNCVTPERMNEQRQLLIDIVIHIKAMHERLDTDEQTIDKDPS